MAAACGLFSAFGIALLIAESAGDRLFGAILVLFFGVGGVVYFLLPRFTRHGGEGVHLGRIKFRGSTRPALVFPQSRGKRRVGVIGAGAFTIVGVLIVVSANALAEPDESALGVLILGLSCAVVFGLMTIAGLAAEVVGSSDVALLPEGVAGGGPGGGSFIPWDAIAEVDIIEVEGTPLVAVIADDPMAIETSSVGLLLSRFGRMTTGSDLAYAGLVAPPEVLRDAIRHYLEHPDERERIGVEDPARYTGAAVPR